MKKLSLILLVAVLAGCVTGRGPISQAYDRYVEENKPKAEQGTLPWSVYYNGLYEHALAAKAPSVLLSNFSSMIDHANDLEKNNITLEKFMTFRRESQISAAETFRIMRERNRQIQAEESAAAAANMSNALQLMQAGQPRSYQPVQPILPAPGMLYMLQKQSVNGNLRYCVYQGGIVNTISSIDLCPLSINR